MPPVRRKNRSLYPAPPLSEHSCDLGRHSVPQIWLVGGSLDAVEQIDERLEAGIVDRRCKFEVNGEAGQLTHAKIVRMAFPAAPKTWLGFDRSAIFSGCRPNSNFFENLRSRQTARHQQPLQH